MRTFAAQGRDNAALKQFIVCRDLLDHELGVGPSRQTIVLYEEIRNKRRRSTGRDLRGGDRLAVVAPKATATEQPCPTSKPTITVIPFENLSDEPGQDHFATGITHDIVSALLRHRWLSVINAANMLRTGRYSMIADGQVIESNVDYLITGSVRKAGARLRIGVQMVEADSGEHIWSESYDRQLDEIFLVQDEITGTISGHIDVEVGASERRRVLRKSTQHMGAWDCYHLGMSHYCKFTSSDHLEALRLFARSLEFDPEFGGGHAWWSYLNVLSTFYFDAEPTEELFDRALQAAKRAVEIDDQNAIFHKHVGRVYLAQREYAKGLAELGIALDLNPNVAGIYCGMGDALTYEGKYEEAIEQFEKSLQLGPRDPIRWAYLSYGALAQIFAGNFEAALEWSEKASRYPHCQYWAHAHRVVALGHMGRCEEARDATDELLHQQPEFSCRLAERKLYFIKRPEQLQLYLDGLRKAGLPE
jgi:TolB-like protein/tetratricopeptide (TPR) repeat protein